MRLPIVVFAVLLPILLWALLNPSETYWAFLETKKAKIYYNDFYDEIVFLALPGAITIIFYPILGVVFLFWP